MAFLYDEQGKVAGHYTPRKMSPEEREEWDRHQTWLEEDLGLPKRPRIPQPEPLELRFGRLESPEAQARLEWLCEDIRQKGGQQAAENMYRMMIAQSKGKEEAQKEFDQIFPEKNPAPAPSTAPPKP